jgi:hypothetical protein
MTAVRRGAHLLRPARRRHRPGHGTSAMIARPLLGRLRKAMRSADAARSRPGEVTVSPAIGPLPAISVPVNRPMPAHPVDNPRPGPGELLPGSRRARSGRRMVSSWRRTLAATASGLRRSWSIWTATGTAYAEIGCGHRARHARRSGRATGRAGCRWGRLRIQRRLVTSRPAGVVGLAGGGLAVAPSDGVRALATVQVFVRPLCGRRRQPKSRRERSWRRPKPGR